jgi:hypothetical protein
MCAASRDRLISTFFACGYIEEPTAPRLGEKLQVLGEHAQLSSLPGYGHFFFTTPTYADIAQNDEAIWVKLGCVHDGDHLLRTEDIIRRGWVSTDNVQVDAIQGSATLIGLAKREPRVVIYRNLLSVPEVHYWTDGRTLIATDNLCLMVNLIPAPQLNEEALPQHFMHFDLYGGHTYVRDVSQLLVGEMLTWQDGALGIDLRRDLRALSEPETKKPVNAETADWFFEQMKQVVGVYIEGSVHNSATLLSGGVDSSLMQTAINAQPDVDFPFPSFSFVVDIPGFDFEVGYAQEAARLLGTDHTFVRLTPEEYPDWLVQSIEIVGQPLPFDAFPYFLALAHYISDRRDDLTRLFHGNIADGLHGVQKSVDIAQGDKYRSWPVPVLEFVSVLLAPISQSKSYGARKAAEALLDYKDADSPRHYLNSAVLHTDWDLVRRCFPQGKVREVFASMRDLEKRYLDSDIMVEKVNVLGLLTDSVDHARLGHQLGLWYGRECVFPYGDEAIARATFSFEPIARYCSGHRVKPVLKTALESRTPTSVTQKQKGYSSTFAQGVVPWMREGVLCDMVQAIERPAFMERADFEKKLEQPDWFTWKLLNLDLFKKHVLMCD